MSRHPYERKEKKNKESIHDLENVIFFLIKKNQDMGIENSRVDHGGAWNKRTTMGKKL